MVGVSARVELLLDPQVSREEEGELEALFAARGLVPEVRRTLATRGPDELSWLVLAALPVHAFLSGLGEEAIKDVYQAVKKLAGRLGKDRPKAIGENAIAPLVLQDAEHGLRIVLEDDLPAQAYRQLVELDLTRYKIGPLHYDRHRGAWRSELDEASD